MLIALLGFGFNTRSCTARLVYKVKSFVSSSSRKVNSCTQKSHNHHVESIRKLKRKARTLHVEAEAAREESAQEEIPEPNLW